MASGNSCRGPRRMLTILDSGGEQKLVRGAGNATQPKPTKTQVTFEMGKCHFDLAPLPGRALKSLGSLQPSRMLAFGFEQIASDDPLCSLSAVGLEGAGAAIFGARKIGHGAVLAHQPSAFE